MFTIHCYAVGFTKIKITSSSPILTTWGCWGRSHLNRGKSKKIKPLLYRNAARNYSFRLAFEHGQSRIIDRTSLWKNRRRYRKNKINIYCLILHVSIHFICEAMEFQQLSFVFIRSNWAMIQAQVSGRRSQKLRVFCSRFGGIHS